MDGLEGKFDPRPLLPYSYHHSSSDDNSYATTSSSQLGAYTLLLQPEAADFDLERGNPNSDSVLAFDVEKGPVPYPEIIFDVADPSLEGGEFGVVGNWSFLWVGTARRDSLGCGRQVQ
jgi:hypothetical protein